MGLVFPVVSISNLVALSSGPVFKTSKTKIACDLFSRKARTYPKNCFILEVIKLTSVRKMEGQIGSSYENDDFMSRLGFLLERIHKPPFCPREKCCHFHSKVFFLYSEMTVLFNSKTELTSEEKNAVKMSNSQNISCFEHLHMFLTDLTKKENVLKVLVNQGLGG